MSVNKRYYWLKMPESFFEEEEAKYIEEQPNGYEYETIYLKLLLKSITSDGILIRHVGKMVIPYETETLAKFIGHNPDTVRVAMDLFIHMGIVEVCETGEIFMTKLNEMVGSETASTERSRICRARKKALQCNTGATQSQRKTENLVLPECCEPSKNATAEYRDKSIENRDIKSVEKETKKKTKPSASRSGQWAEPISRIVSYLNEKTGRNFSPKTADTQKLIIARLKEGHSEDDFYKVIDNKTVEWINDPDMQQYLRPATLFGKKFEGYLNSRPVQRKTNSYISQSDEVAAQAHSDYMTDYLRRYEY